MTKRDPVRKQFDEMFLLLAEGVWRFEDWRQSLRDALFHATGAPEVLPVFARYLDNVSAEKIAAQKPRRRGRPGPTKDERAVERLTMEVVARALYFRGGPLEDPFFTSDLYPVLKPMVEKRLPPRDVLMLAVQEYAGRESKVSLRILACRVLKSDGGRLGNRRLAKLYADRLRKSPESKRE
jgi:hypothetical protein